MRCYQCKHELRAGQEFCARCGAPQGFDAELISAAEVEDPAALKELYQRSLDSVYFSIRALVRDEEAVFRILENSYVLAFRNLDRLQDPTRFLPWMQTVARNRSVEYLQQVDPSVFTETEEESAAQLRWQDDRREPLPDVLLERKSAVRMVNQILDALPNDQRVAAALYYCERVSLPAIAAKLGLSESTVISRLIRARQRIEARVEPLRQNGQFPTLSAIGFFRLMLRSREAAYAPVQVDALFDRIILGMQQREEVVRSRGKRSFRLSGQMIGLAAAAVAVIALLVTAGVLLSRRGAAAEPKDSEDYITAIEATEPEEMPPEQQEALAHPLVLQAMETYSYQNVSVEYPVFIGEKSEAVNRFVQDWVAEHTQPADPGNPEATSIHYHASVTLLSDRIVSMIFYGDRYTEGDAYPLRELFPINLDLDTMEQFHLRDLYAIDGAPFAEAFFYNAVFPTMPSTSYTADTFREARTAAWNNYTAFLEGDCFLKPGGVVITMDMPHASGCDHFEGQVPFDTLAEFYIGRFLLADLTDNRLPTA